MLSSVNFCQTETVSFIVCTADYKSDIINYAKKHNLNWNEESYNHDTKYARVRVSKNILPEMYKINPGFDYILESKFKDKLHRDGYR